MTCTSHSAGLNVLPSTFLRLLLLSFCFLFIWQVLLEWINEELSDHRIIVKDIEEDMYDGQVLQKLVGMS